MEQTIIANPPDLDADSITVEVATNSHEHFAERISELIEQSALQRGTGIARRPPDYIRQKMREGKAIIAHYTGELVGFCYIETWEHGRYVANSGLIVAPSYRRHGIARRIKWAAFALSRKLYPTAKIFSITTSAAVLKLNSEIGFRPVHFSELTSDDEFWRGCQSCRNYDILQRTGRTMCLCTGLLYDPLEHIEHPLPLVSQSPTAEQP
ncbi:MAG: GNAT family N-acetyltransferase [Chlorobi bacterium]|nr:GNAT family N-acetyltransferase [Chlorobiota bacterium]